MGSYLEQILQRSNVVRAVAAHYGLDYGTALLIADGHRRNAAGEGDGPWFASAVASSQAQLGSTYGGFRKLLQDVMIRRFGEGARIYDDRAPGIEEPLSRVG